VPPSTGSTPALAADQPPGRLLNGRFVVLTLAGLAYFTGWTTLYPVLPRFVEDELGGGGVAVGLSVGAFGITAALLRPLAGRIGDRRGRRVLVVGGQLLVAAALLGYLVATTVPQVIALRLGFGVGEAFAFVGLATAIQDLAPDDRRGEAASYFSVAVYGGVALGPLVGEWLFERSGFDEVWLTAAALTALGAVLGLATPSHPAGEPSAEHAWIHPAAVLPGLALTGGLFGYAGFVSFVALYADGIDLPGAGWVFTTYAVLIMCFRLAGARVPDRVGAARVAAASLVALGAGLLVVASWASPIALYGGVVIFAMGMAMNFPALLALVVNRAGPADRAFAVASISVFFDLAFAGGAVVMGAVVALTSERWAFAFGGLCALLGLVPLVAGERRAAAVRSTSARSAPAGAGRLERLDEAREGA
jgi:MFS family permease